MLLPVDEIQEVLRHTASCFYHDCLLLLFTRNVDKPTVCRSAHPHDQMTSGEELSMMSVHQANVLLAYGSSLDVRIREGVRQTKLRGGLFVR